MLDQAIHQACVQRARGAHQRSGKQAEYFIHVGHYRRVGTERSTVRIAVRMSPGRRVGKQRSRPDQTGDHLGHLREGVVRLLEQLVETNLVAAAVRGEAQVMGSATGDAEAGDSERPQRVVR
jgi:hypothetical protein